MTTFIWQFQAQGLKEGEKHWKGENLQCQNIRYFVLNYIHTEK